MQNVRKSILLAEGDPNDILLLRTAFQEIGVKNPVKVVESEAQAKSYLTLLLEHGKNNLPLLIIVALRLQPFKDFSLIRWIRAQKELGSVAVFVLSGVGMKEEERKAHDLGSDCYATKPVDFQGLVKIAQELRDRWIAQPRDQ